MLSIEINVNVDLINFLAGISRVAPPSKISPTADNSYISHQCILLGLHQVDFDDAGDEAIVQFTV